MMMQRQTTTKPSQSVTCSYETYRSTDFFSSLDGLRCLSILAVIWHHTGVNVEGYGLTRLGYLGVDLFFAISGFLITTLLLREREVWGRISLKAFFIRRTLRIFPLYYTVIAMYVIVVWLLERTTFTGREFFAHLPYFLTYTSNWFVKLDGRVIFYFAWSLATEEQFYLVWPMVEKFIGGWKAVGLIAAILVARVLVGFAIASGTVSGDNLGAVIFLSINPAILGGVAMAHVLHCQRTFDMVRPVLGGRWTAVLMLAGLVAVAGLDMPLDYIRVLMVLLVGSVVVSEFHSLRPILTWRPVAHIGMVSYGMYLMHMLSYNAVKKVFFAFGIDHEWLWFPASVAVATSAATISHRYYESWFLRFKNRYARMPTQSPVDVGAEATYQPRPV